MRWALTPVETGIKFETGPVEVYFLTLKLARITFMGRKGCYVNNLAIILHNGLYALVSKSPAPLIYIYIYIYMCVCVCVCDQNLTLKAFLNFKVFIVLYARKCSRGRLGQFFIPFCPTISSEFRCPCSSRGQSSLVRLLPICLSFDCFLEYMRSGLPEKKTVCPTPPLLKD